MEPFGTSYTTTTLVCKIDHYFYSTTQIQTAQIGDRVQITIADNAAGIPIAIQSRLFDPFFTTKPIGKGTGLGLSISHQIITEKHQGRLWCDSIAGQGTKFTVEIPVKQRVLSDRLELQTVS